MNITARRISGSAFTAEDKLEVTFNSDNQVMYSVVHTIELVSGSNVTHGGGGQPNEYLHYKAVERDADSDGIIDYSAIEIALVQESQGVSVIKVVCEAVTKESSDALKVEVEAYLERKKVALGLEKEFTEEAPILIPTVLKTGEITLEWTTDTFT
jgi:hypothetical protein